MAEALIANTKFSVRYVLDKMFPGSGLGSGIAQNSGGFEARDITNGAAFTSTILSVKFRWKDGAKPDQVPESVVMKVPSSRFGDEHSAKIEEQMKKAASEEERAQLELVLDKARTYLILATQKEIGFYAHFPRFEPSLRVPRFYYGEELCVPDKDGLLLMEDLTQRGTTVPMLPGFSERQVWALVDEIARVHATSWKHPEWQQIEGLCEADIHPGYTLAAIGQALKLKEIDSAQFGDLVDRLLPLFNEQHMAMSIYSGPKYGFRACLVHGDMWAANVLWERNAEGEASDRLCALIDWQFAHPGNPCGDLLAVLSANVSTQFCESNRERLLEHYADRVRQHMGGQTPFTMAQLREAYKHALPCNMANLCYGTPFYFQMDSVVGREQGQRKANQRELLQRVRASLQDTADAFGV